MIEKQLHEMQQNQRREKCVQMNVKRVAPFDVRIDLAAPQIPIGHQPHKRGHNNATQQKVNEYHIEEEVDALADAQIQGPREPNGSYWIKYLY